MHACKILPFETIGNNGVSGILNQTVHNLYCIHVYKAYNYSTSVLYPAGMHCKINDN